MQMGEALRRKKEWGNKSCKHERWEREHYLGTDTGDKVCSQCGINYFEWSRHKKKLAKVQAELSVRFMRFKPDTEWFFDHIKMTHGSLRKFSPRVVGKNGKSLDVAAVSRLLAGKRDVRLEEVQQIANLIKQPVVDVLRHFGMTITI